MSWWSIEKDLRERIAELEGDLARELECTRTLLKEKDAVWQKYEGAIEQRDQARVIAGTMLLWAQCSTSLMADNPWLREHPGVQGETDHVGLAEACIQRGADPAAVAAWPDAKRRRFVAAGQREHV